MKKVIDYKVVGIGYVSEALRDGWQPYGNPYSGPTAGQYQAVVKLEGTPLGDSNYLLICNGIPILISSYDNCEKHGQEHLGGDEFELREIKEDGTFGKIHFFIDED